MKDLLGKDTQALRDKKLFLFDLDGTLYRETRLFGGVKELLQTIKEEGGEYVFISNNSSRSVQDYVKKLSRMRVPVTEDNFFTSAMATQIFLAERYQNKLIYVQGTRSFLKQLQEGGLNVTARYDKSACAVVVGTDTEITGAKLRRTCKMLSESEIPFYATHLDLCYPSAFGHIPDCGSMCFAIEKATGRKPIFFGKPNSMMIDCAIQKKGVTAEQTVVVGDNLYTDILAGINAGVETVCVLTGEATLPEIAQSEIKPTFVLNAATDLFL